MIGRKTPAKKIIYDFQGAKNWMAKERRCFLDFTELGYELERMAFGRKTQAQKNYTQNSQGTNN